MIEDKASASAEATADRHGDARPTEFEKPTYVLSWGGELEPVHAGCQDGKGGEPL